MKILSITDNIMPATPIWRTDKDEHKYYVFVCGCEPGWEYVMPISASDYPSNKDFEWKDEEFSLIPVGRKDWKGNEAFVLEKLREPQGDNQILLLVNTMPGVGGTARFSVHGEARIIARATHQFSPNPDDGIGENGVVLIAGPCRIEINRTGYLGAGKSKILAIYDGKIWHVGDEKELAQEAAVFEDELLATWI